MEEKPARIFQQFILDADALLAEVEQTLAADEEIILPGKRWKEVRKALLEQGFAILHGQSTIGSVPVSVIVGVPMEAILQMPVKDYFYELARKHKLPFASGECYLEDPGLEAFEGEDEVIDLIVS